MAKVIGIGGQLTRKEINYDIASFAAGNVISSSTIEALRNKTGPDESWPVKFPHQNTELTFAMMTGYSFDWKKEDEQLEFKIVKPDQAYPYYPNADEARDEKGYLSLLENVKNILIEVANAVYGNPCKEGKFTSECAFARCANGYYKSRDDKCVKYPVMPSLSKEEEIIVKILTAGAIAGIVIGAVAVVVVVVVIVVCIVKRKKSKKTRNDDYLNVRLTQQNYAADKGVPIKL
ncbi:uncharacterized protein MONOS_3573 [Monocercomonoides exilis]|uniref:uncharacterized protein n=1 Tax=Monocercomonoides exilis TaxID=2049356 RepID=UPI00355A3091|nr:hypothetical protein MONOS_3573 [Monocercomonoides exilis]|eukprot:MONOS_3573.1-p1 / transcript=MONOS_3573.1 / gene=MONOS_3573 / organism=Monocercomonoides_exilis_PA203 / gene_product=unspecified product / transcript_product=unspecified product / location=Mono_scaffold00085:26287-27035(+) / protein_length=233 / sequence_SO=supercontig / SO=protein_coding / is_pseudo=false